MPKEENIFDLEKQYSDFLKRMGLDESRMPPIQKAQIKQTFFGAMGAAIHLMLELGDMEETAAVESLDSLNNQVVQFFLKETSQQN